MSAPNVEETRVRHAARKAAVTDALTKGSVPLDAPHGYVLLELALEGLYNAKALESETMRKNLVLFIHAAISNMDQQRG